jgi:hypothetical protein
MLVVTSEDWSVDWLTILLYILPIVSPRCVVLSIPQEMTWSEIIEMTSSIERWHPILPESKEHAVVVVFAIRTSLWSLLVKLATDKIA